MKKQRHSQHSQKKNQTPHHAAQKCAAENVIVFSPTTCASSEKKANDSKQAAPIKKKEKSKSGGLLNLNLPKLPQLDPENLLDGLSDDFILMALIAILIYERFQLKKDGAGKDALSDYDFMILSLLYILL